MAKKRRQRRDLAAVLACLLFLTGCWDAREVEERSTVTAVGVDKAREELEVSIQVPIPIKVVSSGVGGGGGESGQEAVQILSGKGKTWFEAINDIQDQAHQELFFGHNRLLLISEDVMRQGLGEMTDALRRQPLSRRRQYMVVVDGKAKEAIRSDPKWEQIPMEYFLNLIETGAFEINRFTNEGLDEFYKSLSTPGKNPVLNYLRAKPEGVNWEGLAVMKKDKMVGVLDEEHTRLLLQIRSEQVGSQLAAPCGKNGNLIFKPKDMGRKIHVRNEGGRPAFDIDLEIRGEVLERTCKDLKLSKEASLRKAEEAVQQAYRSRARETVRRLQKEWKTDGFNLGNHLRAYHPQLWKRMDWEKEFPDVPIHVRYKVVIRRYGLRSD